MSLRHPTDPRRWKDGTKRSTGNVFDLAAQIYRVDIERLQRQASQKQESARLVEKRRAAGHSDTFHGMSRKADRRHEQS